MHEGRCVLTGTPRDLFADEQTLAQYRLEVPRVVRFQRQLEQKIGQELPALALTEEELATAIASFARGERP